MAITRKVFAKCGTSLNLRACPFCGGFNLSFTPRDQFDEITSETGDSAFDIECLDCPMDFWILPSRLSLVHTREHITNYDFVKDIAEKLWNDRVNDSEGGSK